MSLDYGRSLFTIGVRAISGFIPGGAIVQLTIEEFGPSFCEAVWKKLKGWTAGERQAALEQMGQLSVEEARALAKDAMGGSSLDARLRAQAIEYLAAIPMATRRTLVQPKGGSLSLPSSQVPNSQSDLLRFLPLRPPRFQPGHRLPGHDYELERLLGQGGFGEVWLARNPHRPLQKPRAVKFCLDEQMRLSLERETSLLDRIEEKGEHPGIVRLLQTALSAEPPFLVYEFVPGGDLTHWLALRSPERPRPAEVVAILLQVADALGFAHRLGLIHRDLKPSNILMDEHGQVKLADFGIGAIVAEQEMRQVQSQSKSRHTMTAAALQGAYTPMYADRAQKRGEAVDAKADIYAVGVLSYQLLMGDVTLELSPYFRDELESALVPPELIGVISSCLSLPERRLRDGAALLEALAPVARSLGLAEHKPVRESVKEAPLPEPPRKIHNPPPPPPPKKEESLPLKPPPPPPPPPAPSKPSRLGRLMLRGGLLMALLAGVAYLTGEGRVSEEEALTVGLPGLVLMLLGFGRQRRWGCFVLLIIAIVGFTAVALIEQAFDPFSRRGSPSEEPLWEFPTPEAPTPYPEHEPSKESNYSIPEWPTPSDDDFVEESTPYIEVKESFDLNGTWHGANGFSYQIQQTGSQVFFQEYDAYGRATGGAGQGSLAGVMLDVQYRTSLGAMGRCVYQVFEGGGQMTGTCSDFSTGTVSAVALYR